MAIISRRQYDHPALATAGGSALHASISNLYTVLGDDSMSRYKAFTAVANSSVGVIAHEFGLDFANLKVQIFTGTYPALTLVSDPIGTGWTVAATSGLASRSIDVTAPASGGPHTYAVLVSHESNATAFIPGLVSIGAQIFAGPKTFSSTIVGSISGNAATVTTNANLTGEATSSGSNAVTLTNSAVIGKVLTGYVSGAGTVAATDSILQAFQKINGNDALKAPLASPTFTGTVTLPIVSANAAITIGTSSYFKGNATNGYRFNNAADTSTLVKIIDSGQCTFGSSTTVTTHQAISTAPSLYAFEVNNQSTTGRGLLVFVLNASASQNALTVEASTGERFSVRNDGFISFGAAGGTLGSMTSAGAWTLGPASSVNENLIINGTVRSQGYSPLGGTHTGNGSMKFGSIDANCGVIQYDTNSTTLFSIDNTYDNAAAVTQFRMRTESIPNTIVAGKFTGSGAWTLGASTGASVNAYGHTFYGGILSKTYTAAPGSYFGGIVKEVYSTNTSQFGAIYFAKSNSESLDTLAATADGTTLGFIGAMGVVSALTAFASSNTACGIQFVQNGVNTGTRTPGMIQFHTSSTTAGSEKGRVDSAGAWTLGPAVTNNNTGQRHLVSGALYGSNVTSTDESGIFVLGVNTRISPNTAEDGRTNTTTGGIAIRLENRTVASSQAIGFYSNQPGDATNTAATVIGNVTHEGAWTLGATTTSTVHTINSGIGVGASMVAVYKSGLGSDAASNYYMTFGAQGFSDQGYLWNNASGNIELITASDINLKENIRDADYGLTQIMGLRPVTFDWKSGAAQDVRGFIAQEVQQVLPRCVNQGPDGNLQLGKDEFIPIMVKALQELSAKNDALEARLAALES
jgi:hypothetical protein